MASGPVEPVRDKLAFPLISEGRCLLEGRGAELLGGTAEFEDICDDCGRPCPSMVLNVVGRAGFEVELPLTKGNSAGVLMLRLNGRE